MYLIELVGIIAYILLSIFALIDIIKYPKHLFDKVGLFQEGLYGKKKSGDYITQYANIWVAVHSIILIMGLIALLFTVKINII